MLHYFKLCKPDQAKVLNTKSSLPSLVLIYESQLWSEREVAAIFRGVVNRSGSVGDIQPVLPTVTAFDPQGWRKGSVGSLTPHHRCIIKPPVLACFN